MRILDPLGHYHIFPLAVQQDSHLKQGLVNFFGHGPGGRFSLCVISATNTQLVEVVERQPVSVQGRMGMTVFHWLS